MFGMSHFDSAECASLEVIRVVDLLFVYAIRPGAGAKTLPRSPPNTPAQIWCEKFADYDAPQR
jgi:hypothetical protein